MFRATYVGDLEGWKGRTCMWTEIHDGLFTPVDQPDGRWVIVPDSDLERVD